MPLTDIPLTEVNFQDTLREIDIVLRVGRAVGWRAGTPRLSARFDPGRDSHGAYRGAELEWNRRETRADSVSMADPGQHPGDRQMATIGTDFPAALRWMDWNAGLLGARPV